MKKYWYTPNPEMHSKWGFTSDDVGGPELFYDLGAYGAIATWEKYKDIIPRTRALYGQDALRNAEFLA